MGVDKVVSVRPQMGAQPQKRRHIPEWRNIADKIFNPNFRSCGGCEYVRGNWRESGAGHIRRVIC